VRAALFAWWLLRGFEIVVAFVDVLGMWDECLGDVEVSFVDALESAE
jgi:hypothetical protein